MQPYPHRLSRRMFGASLVSALALPGLTRAGTPATPTILRDLKYGPDPLQALDLYLPASARNAPVLVMVHGGGWVIGDKSNKGVWQNKLRHWGSRGYVLASLNYRLAPEADPLEQAGDVARAIALLQRQIARHGGNPQRMAVMGHSAGGHLVSLLAADASLLAARGALPWRATVSLDGAALDVETIMRGPHKRTLDIAFGDDPAYWRAASPMARLSGTPAPFLLVCSTQRPKSCARANAFARALTARGTANATLPVDLSHDRINSELGRPGAYTEAVDAFLDPILG